MMECPNCGEEIDDDEDVIVCPECEAVIYLKSMWPAAEPCEEDEAYYEEEDYDYYDLDGDDY